MNGFYLRLDELDEEYGPRLTSVALKLDELTLTLHLLGMTWDGSEMDERWQIVAGGVAEHRLTLGEVNPCLESEHPRLRERQVEWVRLMFAASPLSETALLNDLRPIHAEEDWGPFGRFGLGGQLSFGSGVFAVGPQPLMTAYQHVLEAHGMRPSYLWPGPHPAHHSSPPPVFCLHLGGRVWADTFILAQSFHATPLP